MAPHFTFGVGLLGFAWWLISRALRHEHKAKQIPRGKALTVREPDELSVLCFNVLADNLVRTNPCYNYANELYRSWEYRWDRIKEEIAIMDADIICLQEVEIEKWSDWKEYMETLGYGGILLKRNRGKKQSRHQSITNATFFRKRRFKVCWEEHRSRVLGVALKWTTIADNEQKVYVINVHLEGHPYKPTERAQQVQSILKMMEKEEGPTADISDVIFCGDFNSSRWNAPWQYLYRGRLEAGYTEVQCPDVEVVSETTVHPYALQDAYKTAEAIPDFTTRAPKRRIEVDFIFCSRHFKVAAVLRSLDPQLIPSVDRNLLPNRLTPSDHLPIGAVLLMPKYVDVKNNLRATNSETQQQENDNGTYFERRNNSVSSDNANNIEMNNTTEKSVVHDTDERTKAQKRFLATCVMP